MEALSTIKPYPVWWMSCEGQIQTITNNQARLPLYGDSTTKHNLIFIKSYGHFVRFDNDFGK